MLNAKKASATEEVAALGEEVETLERTVEEMIKSVQIVREQEWRGKLQQMGSDNDIGQNQGQAW